jgi:quercetin dioxygenase-like cupin family protein
LGKRRDILKLAGLPVAALLAQDEVPVTSGIRDPQQARLGKTPVGDARTYYYGQTGQLKNLRAGSWQIAPGKSPHNVHQHPDEELLIITEGTGTATVDGKTFKVAPGSIMYCAGNVPHGVLNTGDAPMFFYFIRWIA